MHDFNFSEVNTLVKHIIYILCMKYNINFNIKVVNLCNLKILVAKTIIKLFFLKTLR